jgi:type IV pilus assembly protein PilA
MPHVKSTPHPGGPGKVSSRKAGFSLIELLIVVAVILIICAIAIPTLLRSRMAANEAAATSALRVVSSMNVRYLLTYQQGFSQDLKTLGPPPSGQQPSPTAADLIDSVLASGIKNGYSFVYTPLDPGGTGSPTGYTVQANPVSPGQTGNRYFYIDQTNAVHVNLSGPADRTSPTL